MVSPIVVPELGPEPEEVVAELQANLAARPEAVAWRERAEADGFRGLEDL